MMKKIVLLIFGLVIANPIFAQLKERYIHTDEFTYHSYLTVHKEHIFMNKSHNISFWFDSEEEWIVKLDFDLNSIDSINLSQAIGLKTNHVAQVLKIQENSDGGLYVLLNEEYDTLINGRNFRKDIAHLIDLSTTQNQISVNTKTTFESHSVNYRLLDLVEFGDSIVLTGVDLTPPGNSILTTMHKNGAMGREILLPDSTFSSLCFSMSIRQFNSSFLLGISSGFGFQGQYAKLSSSFNVEEVYSIQDTAAELYMLSAGHLVNKSDGEYDFLGIGITYKNRQQGPGGFFFNFGVAHLDTNLRTQSIDTFDYVGFDYGEAVMLDGGSFDSYDHRVEDSVFAVIAAHNGGVDSLSNDIYFYNYNSRTSSMNWMRVYNSGYLNSGVASAEVLPNNEYLIGLNEFNWDKYPYNNSSIHLMILGPNGNILSEPENQLLELAIDVYPNPTNALVNVKGLDAATNYTAKVVDLKGRLIYEKALKANESIDLSQMAKGTYILQIFQEGNQMGIAKQLILN